MASFSSGSFSGAVGGFSVDQAAVQPAATGGWEVFSRARDHAAEKKRKRIELGIIPDEEALERERQEQAALAEVERARNEARLARIAAEKAAAAERIEKERIAAEKEAVMQATLAAFVAQYMQAEREMARARRAAYLLLMAN